MFNLPAGLGLDKKISAAAATWAATRVLISQFEVASTSSWAAPTTNVLNSGEFGIISYAVDNTNTTDGDFSEITSVTDAASNTWVKAGEFTNGQGAAIAGATVSVWYTKATSTLSAGGNITINIGTARTAKAVTGHVFTTTGTITNVGSSTVADDATDLSSLSVTPSSGNREHLYIRACASESQGTTYTQSTNFTAFDHSNSTTSGIAGSAKNMGARGEYRIVTNSSDTTDPTGDSGADHASYMVALDTN